MFELDEEPNIDLTPLIDVVFMLLIFFIMTATFSKPVLDIVLPEASQAKANNKQASLLIAIKADGSLHHNGEVLSNSKLISLLDSKPEEILNLYVDTKTPFEAFIKVVDLAKQKRGGRFVISTQPASD